jgi:hypothetical protein
MDDLHTRELIIAFRVIVVVWSLACGLTFASTILYGREPSSLDGPTALVCDWLTHEDAATVAKTSAESHGCGSVTRHAPR